MMRRRSHIVMPGRLPMALMGLAVALPLAMSLEPATARVRLTDATERAELYRCVAEAARQWCQRSVTPKLAPRRIKDTSASDLTPRLVWEDILPTSAVDELPSLIDLPPPIV